MSTIISLEFFNWKSKEKKKRIMFEKALLYLKPIK